ncbi:DUF1877 family protein [Paraflavitalea pollutisoli]|uniref:DUF1877 family protein n=1 Tax=Paraflavitalea pollutisoli TaxID=3034143 RepID=UPI0023EC9DB2|nr:DUF1877 family protein [Paraflavitalea sp. H1-2-19X]
MSQSATLYRIGATDFESVVQDPAYARFRALSKEFVSLQGTHEGFRFLLSIGRSAAEKELVTQLFYPAESLEDAHEGEDLSGDAIHYNNPDKVFALASLLAGVDDTTLTRLYDANELNENDVYPGAWSVTTSADIAFNVTHILQEWPLLKGLYTRAASDGDVVISFVG